ncbi:MAG: hypothetical protein JWM56_1170 [Candidatus Peribacteria bacterium]|nr:hypothetical protein [Candidatus Peribacteria bacterium]
MRALWNGTISFGLITIPVKLYPATKEGRLDMDILHQSDLGRIHYARICSVDGKEVPYKDVVKGYEVSKGHYVVLTDDDFRRANARKTKSIDIVGFARQEEVDPIYYEKPYYLEPANGAEKAYALLREALRRSDKVGIATFVLRNHEHVAVLRPYNSIIVLNQLRFQTELRDMNELQMPDPRLEEREMAMAMALVEHLTEEFHPEEFRDTYTDELLRVIRDKSKGRTPKQKEKEPEPTKVSDLSRLLQESMRTGRQKFPTHIR